MLAPCPANRHQVEHTERLRRAFHALTGRDLLDPALSPRTAPVPPDAARQADPP